MRLQFDMKAKRSLYNVENITLIKKKQYILTQHSLQNIHFHRYHIDPRANIHLCHCPSCNNSCVQELRDFV